MSRSGDVTIDGTAKKLTARLSGTGDLRAQDLLLDTASVKVTGNCEAQVNVKKAGGSRVVKVDRNGVVS
jgi:hypothetical protein